MCLTAKVEVVIALDVGGTSIKGALLDRGGNLRATSQVPTSAGDGPEAVASRIVALARGLYDEATALASAPLAVGIGVPGVVDERNGVARFAANIGWRDLALAAFVEAHLSIPAVLCHDARAAGAAEAWNGAGRGVEHLLFLSLGTGISGALFPGGRPYAGAHGLAGELGHIEVEPGGDLCGCGRRGCLETLASGSAIARRYARRTFGAGGAGSIDAAEVQRRAEMGDPAAAAVRGEAVAALASVLFAYLCILDPELVVVGGGLSLDAGFLAATRDAVAERCTFQVPPRIVAAKHQARAGCIGAGLAAWTLLDTGGPR